MRYVVLDLSLFECFREDSIVVSLSVEQVLFFFVHVFEKNCCCCCCCCFATIFGVAAAVEAVAFC